MDAVAETLPETSPCFLLTGATGFLGRRMLRRLALSGARVCVLVRDGRDQQGQPQSAEARTQALIHDLGLHDHAARIHSLSGDLAAFDAAAVGTQLSEVLGQRRITKLYVVNVAASLSMDHPGQRADKREAIIRQNRQTNVEGLKGLLDLLVSLSRLPQPCEVQHLFHFSTAYAHGTAHGFLPEGPVTATSFNNSYEHSKREGERLVEAWSAAGHGQSTILRPSIVTGRDTPDGYVAWLDSLSQPVTSSEVAGWLRRLLGLRQPQYRLIDVVSQGLMRLRFPWLPILGNRDGVIDLIDAEDVERYSWAVIESEVRAPTPPEAPTVRYLHLSNPQAQTLAEVSNMTLRAFDQPEAFTRRLRIIRGLAVFMALTRFLSLVPVAGRFMRRTYSRTRMLEPYLLRPEQTQFETYQTQAFLASRGVPYRPKLIDERYVRTLIEEKSRLGIRPQLASPFPPASAASPTELQAEVHS